ncbi:MAG TPA: MBL fold metallo-hydrolase [Gaiellales bacterium]|nr:MBL fold metallo-hydrolase [Gaiellales bacterium]
MLLVFLGTRGEIRLQSRRHGHHSALLVRHAGRTVMVDCGRDWGDRLARVRPDAVVITHAHSDHAGGLRDGTQVPVYAPAAVWPALARYPIIRRETLELLQPRTVGPITLEPFPVDHSLRAPAVAYRITAGRTAVLYAPDVARIPSPPDAMRDVEAYVGDGAAVTRGLIRRRDGIPIGHASIREQLDWCAEHGVHRAIFTHCGSEITRDDPGARRRVAALGRERGIAATIAHDGLELTVRARRRPARPAGRAGAPRS